MSKLTKEQLQAMSDKQINTALATLVFDAQGAPYVINQTVTLGKLDKLRQDCLGYELYPHAIDVICGFGMRIDYCNTPNDIMPLAFEHSVSLIKMLSGWRACTNNGIYVVHFFDDENPLRAVVCCLILVLQEWKND